MRKSRRKFRNTSRQMIRKTQPLKNLWDPAKAVLRGKFIAKQAFLKKEERSQIDNLTHHLNELEKEKQEKPSQQKEVIKIKEEINKIKIQKTIEKNQSNQDLDL